MYVAPDETAVREHATRGGFPANRIARIERIVDPTTSE
ncbi:MAG TPA: nickel-binding protein [Phycisphaerae bacterium]